MFDLEQDNETISNSVNGYITAAFAISFFLVGLPLNALVIGITLWKRFFIPEVILKLNLAVSNLLVCLLVLPLTATFGLGGDGVFGDVPDKNASEFEINDKVCQTGVFLLLLPLVSSHTLVLISIDRFMYLKRPLTYKTTVTQKRILVAIVLVWILSIGLSIPTLPLGLLVYSPPIRACGVHLTQAYILPVTVEIVLVLLPTCASNGWIIYISQKSVKKKYARDLAEVNLSCRVHEQNSQYKPRNRRTSRDVGRTFCNSCLRVVWRFIAVFSVGVVADLITAGLTIFILYKEAPVPLYPLTYLLYLFRTVRHPLLTITTSPHIRGVILNCVVKGPKACCEGKESDSGGVEMRAKASQT